jgi:hypothetical protein
LICAFIAAGERILQFLCQNTAEQGLLCLPPQELFALLVSYHDEPHCAVRANYS